MEKTNKTQTTLLSEIHLNGHQTAKFKCTVLEEAELSFILQDEMGRSQLQQRYTLEAGSNELSFSVASLKKGTYNAWIDVKGETFIRPLVIDSVVEPGIVGKFKQWFNFL